MTLSFPRANIGLSRFAASIPPLESLPAIMRWISSINKMTCVPSSPDFSTSLSTALTRSSYSPLYFAPAIKAPISNARSRLSRLAGTSRSTILCASPSAIAVFPTPGSPIRTGFPFVRLDSTRMTRRISLSRPITGSSLPCSANAVKSIQYLLRASNWASAPRLSTFRPPRLRRSSCSRALTSIPAVLHKSASSDGETLSIARIRWSIATNWSFCSFCCF
jgi:hypothetical protein